MTEAAEQDEGQWIHVILNGENYRLVDTGESREALRKVQAGADWQGFQDDGVMVFLPEGTSLYAARNMMYDTFGRERAEAIPDWVEWYSNAALAAPLEEQREMLTGMTPGLALDNASALGLPRLVESLLEDGFPASEKFPNGRRAIYLACVIGKNPDAIIPLLLAAGAVPGPDDVECAKKRGVAGETVALLERSLLNAEKKTKKTKPRKTI